MIPKNMEAFLIDKLTESTFKNRMVRDGSMCFLELRYSDEHLLSRLGITRDKLGPMLVACVWDEASHLEIGGYLVVDNLSMGSPSMGGIRMLPDITPIDIHNLARGMTLKNGAANLPYGGGKSGIVAGNDLTDEEHTEVVRGFARLIYRYREIYVPGPDVGTNDNDMKTIALENGLDSAVSKPADMGGNRIDELGGAAGGVIIALQTLTKIMPRLRVLPQFSGLEIPEEKDLTVMFQGYGAVGAHASRILKEKLPKAQTIGLSDMDGYLYDEKGLPVDQLYEDWKEKGLVTRDFYKKTIDISRKLQSTRFSTDANSLLRESAFCFVPAAAVFNYLGVLPSENASMNVDRIGDWSVIIEGANTYSPDPNKKAIRARLEQIVYRQKGVMIANDYLVNSGGVIFAAQEHIIPTPDHLQIPKEMLGNRKKVDAWLAEHKQDFRELSRKRLEAGEIFREKVIRRNMIELVDILAANPDCLPCTAAERISLMRLTAKEHERTAKDIMIPIRTIPLKGTIRDAANAIVQEGHNIIAVLDKEERISGIVTAWNIARSVAGGDFHESKLEDIMTRDVVSVGPDENMFDILKKLEQNQISAVPVVEENSVIGMINSDLMAQRYLKQMVESRRNL